MLSSGWNDKLYIYAAQALTMKTWHHAFRRSIPRFREERSRKSKTIGNCNLEGGSATEAGTVWVLVEDRGTLEGRTF